MARKFLYVFAALIVVVIGAAFAYRFYGNDLLKIALVPRAEFRAQARASDSLYDRRIMWLARPDIPGNPALWTPAGFMPGPAGKGAAVFFIHPTSYVSRDHWNAPIDDAETNDRTTIFLRGQASAFNGAGEIWAPRYRQATFGAFLTSVTDADRALQLANRDILTAFDSFLRQIGPRRPIILAGHSQGALHLTWLLRRKIAADRQLAKRIVAAYVIGWPVSRTTDIPGMGLPECRSAEQSGCILSWLTFGEPADTSLIVDTYDKTRGFDDQPRRDTPMVCTNPLTGTPDAEAPAADNLGTLFPSKDLTTAEIIPGRVPARCADRGFLLIGEGPDVGPYVLPGNNYHVYDYSLFWANVRADAERRLKGFRR